MTTRIDGRHPQQLRPITFTRNWLRNAEGSVMVEFGHTRVLTVASFTPGVPRWLNGSGKGWVTSEYSMLPRSTHTRSLRAIIDLKQLGENTIVIDCDVLQADGGTRTASITGAYLALADAISWAKNQGHIGKDAKVLTDSVAAVSVGILDGAAMLDLCYEEDVRAETDMNVVCTGSGKFIEVQGTAEGEPFERSLLNDLLDLAVIGCGEITELQRRALA